MTSVPIDAGSAEQSVTRAATGRVGLASRVALVSRILTDALSEGVSDAAPAGAAFSPTVLDCGGGSGTYAVALAERGCDVTVVDLSADALTTLRRRADEAGVSTLVHAIAGDVERLGELLEGQLFDAVLAHGVLDAVDDIPATFAEMVVAVRPGGLLSVLVENPMAVVLARALAGEPGSALADLRALDGPSASVGPDTVATLCAERGLPVVARHGIGVFSDLVPGASLDSPGARQAVAELDAAAADRAPFADLAGRIHLLVRRPTP